MSDVTVHGGRASGVDRRAMGMLSSGHLFTDLNQGAVAALIPFLLRDAGITLAQAGLIVFAATVSSSVVQPLFGIFSDRHPLPILMPLGILLAGVGISLVGVAPGFWYIFACVVVSGIGVAAFHPEAARFANYVSGSKRARGMSYFSVGGNAGVALGPVLATPLILYFGLPGTVFLALPAAVMSAILLLELPRFRTFGPDDSRKDSTSAEQTISARWVPFATLVGVVTLRSFLYFGLLTFIGAYYVQVFDESAVWGNAALTVMLASGAVGTLLLGNVADRVGRKKVLALCMAALGPLTLAFAFLGPVAGIVLVALIGAFSIGTFGLTVVIGQEYLPGRIGLAAGITMGLSIGLGGIGASVLGVVADGFGLTAMMLCMVVLPVIGFILTLTLPRKASS